MSDWDPAVDGKKLRDARISQDFTQAKAARQLGATRSALRSWELGRSTPRQNQIDQIQEQFGVAVAAHLQAGSRFSGRGLRTARSRAALTQKELATKIGVARSTITYWEAGRSTPKPDQVQQLREILGALGESQLADEEGLATSVLGAWVNKNRIERRWTVPELGRRAGITATAIRRIESGRTTNVQSKTLVSLEKALQTKLEPDTKNELTRDARVEGFGEFEDFDPYDEQAIPNAPGVYVLYDISERPIYVGMSRNVRTRLRSHQQKFWFRRPIVESGSFVAVSDEERRQQLETLLIKFLKSNAVLNRMNTDR